MLNSPRRKCVTDTQAATCKRNSLALDVHGRRQFRMPKRDHIECLAHTWRSTFAGTHRLDLQMKQRAHWALFLAIALGLTGEGNPWPMHAHVSLMAENGYSHAAIWQAVMSPNGHSCMGQSQCAQLMKYVGRLQGGPQQTGGARLLRRATSQSAQLVTAMLRTRTTRSAPVPTTFSYMPLGHQSCKVLWLIFSVGW